MMEAAFKELGVDAEYHYSNVNASELGSVFAKLKESGMSGANVTIPHKSSIIPLLDSLDEVPSKIGAVNTIKREEGKYRGFNTDVDGIVGPLKAKGLSKIKRAAVLGTGGAARAFCGAMHLQGCTDLLIIYRSRDHAASLISSMSKMFPELVI
jgi:shikimate dehydrogenase